MSVLLSLDKALELLGLDKDLDVNALLVLNKALDVNALLILDKALM